MGDRVNPIPKHFLTFRPRVDGFQRFVQQKLREPRREVRMGMGVQIKPKYFVVKGRIPQTLLARWVLTDFL